MNNFGVQHVTSEKFVTPNGTMVQARMMIPSGPIFVRVLGNKDELTFGVDLDMWQSLTGDRSNQVGFLLKKYSGKSYTTYEKINAVCKAIDSVIELRNQWREDAWGTAKQHPFAQHFYYGKHK